MCQHPLLKQVTPRYDDDDDDDEDDDDDVDDDDGNDDDNDDDDDDDEGEGEGDDDEDPLLAIGGCLEISGLQKIPATRSPRFSLCLLMQKIKKSIIQGGTSQRALAQVIKPTCY